jgi:hypothetical protein
MRGDPFIRKGNIIRAMAASPTGLNLIEIAGPGGAYGIPPERRPSKAFSTFGMGFFYRRRTQEIV